MGLMKKIRIDYGDSNEEEEGKPGVVGDAVEKRAGVVDSNGTGMDEEEEEEEEKGRAIYDGDEAGGEEEAGEGGATAFLLKPIFCVRASAGVFTQGRSGGGEAISIRQ